jgi:(2Fe-2S) ferredoxin
MPIAKPQYHIMVCNSFRLTGAAQGACQRKDAASLMQCLEEGISDRGIDAQVSSTGCVKICDKGPVMIVYPQGWWYGKVDEDGIEEILDCLENDEVCSPYLIE